MSCTPHPRLNGPRLAAGGNGRVAKDHAGREVRRGQVVEVPQGVDPVAAFLAGRHRRAVGDDVRNASMACHAARRPRWFFPLFSFSRGLKEKQGGVSPTSVG